MNRVMRTGASLIIKYLIKIYYTLLSRDLKAGKHLSSEHTHSLLAYTSIDPPLFQSNGSSTAKIRAMGK